MPQEALKKASPSGRLLDLFGQGSQGESAATAQPGGASTQASAGPAPTAEEERDAVKIILQAVENCKPLVKVFPVRTGSKITHVPKVVSPREQRSLAVRWILDATRRRKESSRGSMAECLALELLLAYRKQGTARGKRDDMHKVALDNRANIQMKWW